MTATVLVLALAATLTVLYVRGTTDPNGGSRLPDESTIDGPSVIEEVADQAGLTCHDEATSTIKIKGCYLQEPGHLVTMRYRIADDGTIDKVNTTILHNDLSPVERADELRSLMEPVLAILPISDQDRAAVDEVLGADEASIFDETSWAGGAEGVYSYRHGQDTSTLSIGRKTTDYLPPTPLTDDYAPIVDELTARGWACQLEDVSLTCTDDGRGKIIATIGTSSAPNNEPRMIAFRVWFNGVSPTVDEPRMRDAYAALAEAGDKGTALSAGLEILAGGGEKHFFNSDVEFYRGESYYDVAGVQFS